MSLDSILALMGFAFVTSITPGPSNLILLAASANFGFRRTLPLVLGLNLSFLSMLLIVGFGLGPLLRANETLYTVLKFSSLFYILWLAWKIARSAPLKSGDGETAPRPLTFLQMALLQWVNPKAWAVAFTVTVVFTTPVNHAISLLSMTIVFGIVNLPSVSAWAVFGSALRNILRDPPRVRAFNLLMAVMLVASIMPIVLGLGS